MTRRLGWVLQVGVVLALSVAVKAQAEHLIRADIQRHPNPSPTLRWYLAPALAQMQATSLGRNADDSLRKALEWLQRCFHAPYASESCR